MAAVRFAGSEESRGEKHLFHHLYREWWSLCSCSGVYMACKGWEERVEMTGWKCDMMIQIPHPKMCSSCSSSGKFDFLSSVLHYTAVFTFTIHHYTTVNAKKSRMRVLPSCTFDVIFLLNHWTYWIKTLVIWKINMNTHQCDKKYLKWQKTIFGEKFS